MSSNPFFFISIWISAIIAFASLAFIVEVSLVLLKKIPKFDGGRVRAVLRCLPFVSLAIDLLFNSLSIGYLFNPLNCYSCVQKFILTVFFPELKTYLYSNEISLIRYLGDGTAHLVFELNGFVLVGITLFFVSRKLIEGIFAVKKLRSMVRQGVPCQRPIENSLLVGTIKRNGVKLFTSKEIGIPMAAYSNVIFLPQELVENFSQEEFESVVSHEVEHLLWKDPLVRFLSQLISSIFWWVPTYGWRKKLEFDQETACDQSVKRYGFKEMCLASALVKVTVNTQEKTHQILCYLTSDRHSSVRRLQLLLGDGSAPSKSFAWGSFLIILLFSAILLVCGFLS